MTMDAAINRFHASEPGAKARERRLRKEAERLERQESADDAGSDGAGDQDCGPAT